MVFKSLSEQTEKPVVIPPDPRGDGPVEDPGGMRNGQPNIIDYSNQEPLLFGLGQNSSHEYPGKIVINNESNYVDRDVKRNTIPNAAATGESQPLNDKTQPTLPTGAPIVIPSGGEPDHNMHGLNFNHKVNWNENSGDQLQKGIKVEMEHTDCSDIAMKIAMDHLNEDPQYYSKLELIDPHENNDVSVTPPEARRTSNEEQVHMQPLKEATFNEQDHPRAPSGTMHGGEFINREGPPMGKSKEDRQARNEYFQDSIADNKNAMDIHDEITDKTIDANYAKLKKNSDEEKQLRDEIEQLKINKENLLKSLKDKNRLEGTQAQRTLQSLEDVNNELENAKPNSKSWEKLSGEKIALEFRLDALRRGVFPDKDFEGNPTNEAAFQQKKEEKRVSDLMSKRPTKTKTKDLEGFKDSPTMKLGKSVDKKHVEQIKEIWNGLDSEDRKLVDNMTIRGSKKSGSITAGEYIKDTDTMEITTHPLFTQKDYEETIHHELAHAKFKKHSPEQVTKWNDAIKEIRAPTKYANYHKQRFDNYRLNNFRVKESDREVVQNNLKALENLYYEEVHSEVYANLKSPLPEKKLWNKEGLESATKIYNEVFG